MNTRPVPGVAEHQGRSDAPQNPRGRPPDESEVAEFHRALTDLIRVYQFRDRDRICCHDISVTQCYALQALAEAGPMRLNDLAERLYLDKSTASRVVDALEAKGYARRGPDPDDGRAVRTETTARGLRLYRRIERELLDGERELLSEFDPEVRRAMTRLLGRLSGTAISRITGCAAPDGCG